MNDKVFLDSNIILYAYSTTEILKSNKANKLIFSTKNIFISKQVINEVINILDKKFKLPIKDIKNAILEINNNFYILDFSLKTQIKALEIKARYQLQYYDSLIISTALENNCSILYTEDMQHNQLIENQLKIINPFN